MLLGLYRYLTIVGTPLIQWHLKKRQKAGKEDSARLDERYGLPSTSRPEGSLIWFHAASVGEAQSLLILINTLLQENKDLHILVTTGTVTSAELLASRLPERAFHQYVPVDQPAWVRRFMEHWKPSMVVFTESEIWPNIMRALSIRHLPVALLNARLSNKSFKFWKKHYSIGHKLFNVFDIILTQTEADFDKFKALGCQQVALTGNMKYCASPLSYDEDTLLKLVKVINGRPTWVYASTHDGEEQIACHVHEVLKHKFSDLLTIIVPRHPSRRDEIANNCQHYQVNLTFRGDNQTLPTKDTDVYCVDTLGELGLFYKLTDIAVIGRSLSLDGGGGHNPIEAAQLGCAILSGTNIQYQEDLFRNFLDKDAAILIDDEAALITQLEKLLSDKKERAKYIAQAQEVANSSQNILVKILRELEPLFLEGGINLHPSVFKYLENGDKNGK